MYHKSISVYNISYSHIFSECFLASNSRFVCIFLRQWRESVRKLKTISFVLVSVRKRIKWIHCVLWTFLKMWVVAPSRLICCNNKLTESFGVDMLVFELVIGCIGVDHNPLHAVTAKLLLSFGQGNKVRWKDTKIKPQRWERHLAYWTSEPNYQSSRYTSNKKEKPIIDQCPKKYF